MASNSSKPLELFCCYARKDRDMLEQLKNHLTYLERQDLITIWSDININAGEEWEREIHQHLESADIFLLLISSDFMGSDYCYSTEMGRAIERHDQGSAQIIPILLRPTFYQNAPFARFQMVPTNAEPVTMWPNLDNAFHDITRYIDQVVAECQIRQVNEHSPEPSYTEMKCWNCGGEGFITGANMDPFFGKKLRDCVTCKGRGKLWVPSGYREKSTWFGFSTRRWVICQSCGHATTYPDFDQIPLPEYCSGCGTMFR